MSGGKRQAIFTTKADPRFFFVPRSRVSVCRLDMEMAAESSWLFSRTSMVPPTPSLYPSLSYLILIIPSLLHVYALVLLAVPLQYYFQRFSCTPHYQRPSLITKSKTPTILFSCVYDLCCLLCQRWVQIRGWLYGALNGSAVARSGGARGTVAPHHGAGGRGGGHAGAFGGG